MLSAKPNCMKLAILVIAAVFLFSVAAKPEAKPVVGVEGVMGTSQP